MLTSASRLPRKRARWPRLAGRLLIVTAVLGAAGEAVDDLTSVAEYHVPRPPGPGAARPWCGRRPVGGDEAVVHAYRPTGRRGCLRAVSGPSPGRLRAASGPSPGRLRAVRGHPTPTDNEALRWPARSVGAVCQVVYVPVDKQESPRDSHVTSPSGSFGLGIPHQDRQDQRSERRVKDRITACHSRARCRSHKGSTRVTGGRVTASCRSRASRRSPARRPSLSPKAVAP